MRTKMILAALALLMSSGMAMATDDAADRF
jgi:hypothetical protein